MPISSPICFTVLAPSPPSVVLIYGWGIPTRSRPAFVARFFRLPSRSPNIAVCRYLCVTSGTLETTHHALIEPTHRNASRQSCRATYNGDEIAAGSGDPASALCRGKARGLMGCFEFIRAGSPIRALSSVT